MPLMSHLRTRLLNSSLRSYMTLSTSDRVTDPLNTVGLLPFGFAIRLVHLGAIRFKMHNEIN